MAFGDGAVPWQPQALAKCRRMVLVRDLTGEIGDTQAGDDELDRPRPSPRRALDSQRLNAMPEKSQRLTLGVSGVEILIQRWS